MKKTFVYVVCSQNVSRIYLGGARWDLIWFELISRIATVIFKNAISYQCGCCWWKTFCGPSTWIFVLIKLSLYREVLVTKSSDIFLFLSMVKNEAILVIKLCTLYYNFYLTYYLHAIWKMLYHLLFFTNPLSVARSIKRFLNSALSYW